MYLATDKTKGIIALILLSLSYALFGFYTRELATDFTPFQQVYARFCVAGIFACLIYRQHLSLQKLSRVSTKDWIILLVRATSGILIGVTLYTKAVLFTPLGVVILVGALPFTAVWGMLLYKERLTLSKVLLLALGFCGVALIAVNSDISSFRLGKGELFAFLSSAFFSFGMVLRKSQGNQLSNSELSVYFIWLAAILVFVASLTTGEGLPSSISWNTWMVLMISGAFICINVLAAQYGFQKLDAMTAGALLNLEVVFAVMLGYLGYGEVLSGRQVIGGGLVIGSALLFGYFDRKSA